MLNESHVTDTRELCDSMFFGEEEVSPTQIPAVPKDVTPEATPPPVPPKSPVRAPRYEVINIDSALANEAFKSFKSQQKEQFERISTFEVNQRKALSTHHQAQLKRLQDQHQTCKDEQAQKVSRISFPIAKPQSNHASSTPTTLNMSKNSRSWQNTTCAKLTTKKLKMSLPPSNTWKPTASPPMSTTRITHIL